MLVLVLVTFTVNNVMAQKRCGVILYSIYRGRQKVNLRRAALSAGPPLCSWCFPALRLPNLTSNKSRFQTQKTHVCQTTFPFQWSNWGETAFPFRFSRGERRAPSWTTLNALKYWKPTSPTGLTSVQKQNSLQLHRGFAPWPLIRSSVPGPRWGLRP